MRLNVGADGTLTPVDFFAPFDTADLDHWDADFGSGALVGLPNTYFGTSSHPRLAVAVGKEGYVYLFDRDNLGGLDWGSGGGDNVLQRLGRFGGVWGRPAVWPGDGGWIYVPTTTNASTLDAYQYGVTGTGAPSPASETVAGLEVPERRSTSMVAARRLTPGTYRLQSVLWDARGARYAFTATLRITLPKKA